jgi:hypothetical protein
MSSQRPLSPTRHGLFRLGFLASYLLSGAILALVVDGFPPSWPVLVIFEALAVLMFVFVDRREARWNNDLPNRIRRNAQIANESLPPSQSSDGSVDD